MGGEIELAAEAVPVAAAAAGVYGEAVLARAWDDVADVTVRAGLRVLQRVFGRKKEGEALPGVLADVVVHPDDGDVVAQFRLAVRRALEADPALAEEVAAIVAGASAGTSAGQHVVAGRDAYVAGRDMTITQKTGDVTNTVSGGTQYGPVLQGRDFTGLTFGAAPPPPSPRPGDPDAG